MFSAVGGCTIHWSAHFPRYHPSDFRVRSLDGVGDDWPLTYDELAPNGAFPVLFVEAMRPSLLVPYRCRGRCRGRLLGDAARLAAFAYRDARLAARA
jgi:hypothetical protein